MTQTTPTAAEKLAALALSPRDALQMFRDYDRLSSSDFNFKWGADFRRMVAGFAPGQTADVMLADLARAALELTVLSTDYTNTRALDAIPSTAPRYGQRTPGSLAAWVARKRSEGNEVILEDLEEGATARKIWLNGQAIWSEDLNLGTV